MAEPAKPDRETRERLLDVLAELVTLGGAGRLLAAPIAPGESSFPDPWAPSKPGVALLLRRLLWYAGVDRAVVIEDRRAEGAPPTERKPPTIVELEHVSKTDATFMLGFVGTDNIAGTLSHEIGVIHALMNRRDAADPYRKAEASLLSVEGDADLERGSIATVYLGLGVLAANAAYQQYSRGGRFNGAYVPLEYDVLKAGYTPMSNLAFLLAVQAIVRGESEPPAGLSGPQRDEVTAWIAALRDRASSDATAALRTRLGIANDAVAIERGAVTAFDDVELADEPAPKKTAFRWHTDRRGLGMITGTVLGIGVAMFVSRGMMPFTAIGGAGGGNLIGRNIRRPRCSGCATIVLATTTTCPRCGAALRGDIAHLSERLEAEERLAQNGNVELSNEVAREERE